MEALQVYRLTPSLRFLQRSWAGECAVYVMESRETHLLNVSCAYVLDTLGQGPTSQQQLAKLLQDSLPGSGIIEVSSLLEEIVDTLSRMGIVKTLENTS